MIFDRVCKVAERVMPDLASILDKSKLFWFPGKPHEFLSKDLTDEDMKFLSEHFMLPFPNVSIEDDGSMVIIIDKDREARGINNERYFIDVTLMGTDGSAYDDFNPIDEARYKRDREKFGIQDKEPMTISFGAIEKVEFITRNDFHVYGRIERVVQACGKAKDDEMIFVDYVQADITKLGKAIVTKHLNAMLKNAMCALQEVLYTNTPNKFILEESSVKRKKRKKGRISRSNERPVYTLLSPNKIRKKMRITENQNDEKHTRLFLGRRTHPRTYRDPRYVNMMGKTVMIPAVWPGENIQIVGNKRYKVMLDL